MIRGPVISFMSVEAVGSSETQVTVYETSRCLFHEDCTVPVFVRLSAYLLTELMLGRCAVPVAPYTGHALKTQKKKIQQQPHNRSR